MTSVAKPSRFPSTLAMRWRLPTQVPTSDTDSAARIGVVATMRAVAAHNTAFMRASSTGWDGASGNDGDRRSHAHPPHQVDHIAVVHPEAAIGGECPDAAGPVGAVDGIFATGQYHCGGTHRIIVRATLDQLRKLRMISFYFGRRAPGRVGQLAYYSRLTVPLLAGASNSDSIDFHCFIAITQL